jgi:hypothetical protein
MVLSLYPEQDTDVVTQSNSEALLGLVTVLPFSRVLLRLPTGTTFALVD